MKHSLKWTTTHIYTEGRRDVTHRLLKNRQGITNVQCLVALDKLICQELEEFLGLVVGLGV